MYKKIFVVLGFLALNLYCQTIPEKDPEWKEEVKLLLKVKNVHPRLLFGPEDIKTLKEKQNTEIGKIFWQMILDYLPSCKPPDHTNFLRDATDAQRQGLWRLPTVALHYALTGDKKSYEKALGYMKLFLSLPDWETGSERNSGMGAASIMVGAALAYDMLYNDLPDDFREEFRKKLLTHARWMYYGGHLNYNRANAYWQNDPGNNHRWFRNAGLFLSILAIYEEKDEEKFIMERSLEEIKLVHKYLPEDGSSHEGPGYIIFGGPMLLFPYIASDRCLGTNFLSHPFFKNVGHFRIQTLTPGFENVFSFGDCAGFGGYHSFLWKCVSYHKEKDVQNGLEKFFNLNKEAFDFGWWNYLWYDPTNSGGNYKNLSKASYFSDIGVVIIRDGWEKENTGVMFKCSPFGGYSLNKYRNENNFKYINVAHDDPDANSFIIYTKGRFVATTDGYSRNKKSANHNTILVDGKGQVAPGRQEGGTWTQPATGQFDMTQLAYITKFKDMGDVVITEGEAGRFYQNLRKFRRSFIWVNKKYLLVLDEILSKGKSTITWLMQGPEVIEIEKGPDSKKFLYQLKNENVLCDFTIISEKEGTPEIKISPADSGGKVLGWKQLNLNFKDVDRLKIVSVYSIWGEKIEIEFQPVDNKNSKIILKGSSFKDEWIWETVESLKEPSKIKGNLDGKEYEF
ncbi:MAG: heparinase II/III family protein [Candidatus Omnitrophica bacterium]|nr:heparinase II/III family protein [Candidatus Omnitrophota bacterium]